MIGSNSSPIISDAFLKGLKLNNLIFYWRLCSKTQPHPKRPKSNGRVINSVGREGVEYYNQLGYVPYDVGINENAARTLEYAYADFTVAQMAQKMGKQNLADQFYKRSLNYKNLFDPQTKWMRGKNKDGVFQSPFNP